MTTTCTECHAGYTGHYCESIIHCFNNGTIVNGYCNCIPPFTDIFCETPICDNGGSVILDSNLFVNCTCRPGWTGKYCTKIEFCFNGFNISEDGTECECDNVYYNGELCDHPICRNGVIEEVKHFSQKSTLYCVVANRP